MTQKKGGVMITKTKSIYLNWAIVCLLTTASTMTEQAIAATTDISPAPLVSSGTTTVLPNVFMMMDDSGSMDWDFIPDYPPGSPPFSTSKFGYASHQCNGVFYNPAIKYTPPVKYDGSSYTDSSFTAAWMDGYNTSKGTVNLSTTFKLGLSQSSGVPGSGVPAYYYVYTGTQTTAAQKNYYKTSGTFYAECNTTASNSPTATIKVSGSSSASVTGILVNGTQIMSGASTPSSNSGTVAAYIASKITLGGYSATASGSQVTITGPQSAAGNMPVVSGSGMTFTPTAFAPFYKVVVSDTSGPGGTDERTNFANWFSYYRTRINMMKTGTGIAFKPLDDHYRVGFATMNNNGGSKFLNLATFDSAQKDAWYTMLYSTYANNSTPLLSALSKVGLMYAHKLPSNTLNGVTAKDPVQYSCQQNFTLLSTDGFWNNATNSTLTGTSVGQQDGAAARPYNDGAQSITTVKTPTTTVVRTKTDSTKTTTKYYQRTYFKTAASKGGASCNFKKYAVYKVTEQSVETIVTQVQSIDDTTMTDTKTEVYTNGILTSTTTSSSSTTANVSTTTEPVSDTGVPDENSTWTTISTSTVNCSSYPVGSGYPAPGYSGTPSAPSYKSSSTSTGSPTTTTISTTGPTTGTPVTTANASGGTSNTLADVAYYYYMTDLRDSTHGNCSGSTGVDVCQDNVPQNGQDSASWQHMTTFTLGLGAFGRMIYSPTYATDTSGDYFSVANGTIANIAGGVCSWGANGQPCNWPTPDVDGTPENIDDLWHAAVNGRGAYFSATDPNSLASGLANALAGISQRLGASAAATTSNPNVTSGDNYLFSSTFDTAIWDGDLFRQQLDLNSGAVSTTKDWSAQAQFDLGAITASSRTIYTYDASSATHIKPFKWSNLTTAEQNYFSQSAISTLSQFCSIGSTCLSTASQTAAAGSTLIDFLRGDRSNEGAATDTSKYYRLRDNASNPHPNIVLGDIVNSEAVYVKGSLFTYNDAGYNSFISTNSSRDGRVYVGSNDGMLHAFDSTTGNEKWAYVPSFVMPNLFKLADKNYANLHGFYVDGTPVASDVYYSGAWHTILVGGLNGGGRGYYALDITDPSAEPTVLWEFSNPNMGYTFGNPVITKLNDGTWVVVVTSGYNNVSPGDGKGHLFVIDASDGTLIRTIDTTVGDTTTPSGLGKINSWVNNGMVDNTATYTYGGDLLGNLWRFDINEGTAQLLVTLSDSGGKPQPITVKPELGLVATHHMIYVGTGRYLGSSDLSNSDTQSFYGIKDPLTSTSSIVSPVYANSRTGFVQQTETNGFCPNGTSSTVCTAGESVRTSSNNTVNLSSDNGWYIDMPDTGERDNTDPTLALGTLVFNTNVPKADACNAGGYSYTYFLDYRTGAAVSTANNISSVKLGNAIATRPVVAHLPNNTIVELTRLSNGTTVTGNVPFNPGSAGTRRVSWRELINE
jgi:type IV pilus assembly protein PilY1